MVVAVVIDKYKFLMLKCIFATLVLILDCITLPTVEGFQESGSWQFFRHLIEKKKGREDNEENKHRIRISIGSRRLIVNIRRMLSRVCHARINFES